MCRTMPAIHLDYLPSCCQTVRSIHYLSKSISPLRRPPWWNHSCPINWPRGRLVFCGAIIQLRRQPTSDRADSLFLDPGRRARASYNEGHWWTYACSLTKSPDRFWNSSLLFSHQAFANFVISLPDRPPWIKPPMRMLVKGGFPPVTLFPVGSSHVSGEKRHSVPLCRSLWSIWSSARVASPRYQITYKRFWRVGTLFGTTSTHWRGSYFSIDGRRGGKQTCWSAFWMKVDQFRATHGWTLGWCRLLVARFGPKTRALYSNALALQWNLHRTHSWGLY